MIRNDLTQLALPDTGKIFPDLALIDMTGTLKNISFKRSSSKYTLIAFWFAHCFACKSEFPTYIELLKTHHKKGFSMIGISIDSSVSHVKHWKSIIRSKSLRWTQYRANSKTINNLRISFYQSNFLIDGEGRIKAINLGAGEAAEFYKEFTLMPLVVSKKYPI